MRCRAEALPCLLGQMRERHNYQGTLFTTATITTVGKGTMSIHKKRNSVGTSIILPEGALQQLMMHEDIREATRL